MILFVLGTRPEALKVVPILRELARRRIASKVVITGQHQHLLAGTGLKADQSLYLPGTNDPLQYAADVEHALSAQLHGMKPPSWVVVQGDTASALGGARWASKAGLPLCHVEAGLRSHDLDDPWPEEGFRVEIDRLACLMCCPTEGNRDNLLRENTDIDEDDFQGFVTGNTIVDQLHHMRVRREPGSHVLVTLHRREAFGEPLKAIIQGLIAVAKRYPDTPFLWPLHPNPHVLEALEGKALPRNVLTRAPLPYPAFIEVLACARSILTDSGGVVEEACTLGVPTVIARDHTERPEAVDCGMAKLAGKTYEGVVEGFTWAFDPNLTAQASHASCFGDGHAAERIVDLLT